MKKQITTKAKGRGRPELNFFDTHIPGSDNKDDIYFYWKAIDDSGKKYKFILFQEENNLYTDKKHIGYMQTIEKTTKQDKINIPLFFIRQVFNLSIYQPPINSVKKLKHRNVPLCYFNDHLTENPL